MRPVSTTVTGEGVSAPIPLDNYISPFNVGFGVVISGLPTYSVQHTFDDVFSSSFNPATATWFTHPTIVNQTTNADGNYAFPVVAVRLSVSAVGEGGGSATFKLIQAGIA
jgi:hypothetical protein